MNDISLFIRLNSIKSITIVTNYGKTKYLTKGENYSKEAALSLYKELLIDVGNQVDKKIVDKFLKKIYNFGIISRK